PLPPPSGPTRFPYTTLFRSQLRRARADLLAHRPLGKPAERHRLAARADRLRQRAEVFRDEEHHDVRRRFLEILEQRVGGILVHRSEEHTSELQSRENLVCRL